MISASAHAQVIVTTALARFIRLPTQARSTSEGRAARETRLRVVLVLGTVRRTVLATESFGHELLIPELPRNLWIRIRVASSLDPGLRQSHCDWISSDGSRTCCMVTQQRTA